MNLSIRCLSLHTTPADLRWLRSGQKYCSSALPKELASFESQHIYGFSIVCIISTRNSGASLVKIGSQFAEIWFPAAGTADCNPLRLCALCLCSQQKEKDKEREDISGMNAVVTRSMPPTFLSPSISPSIVDCSIHGTQLVY